METIDFNQVITDNISVVEELLNTESFANSVYKNFGGNSFYKEKLSQGSGWIRLMNMTDGSSFLINISKSWGSLQPESCLLYIKKAKKNSIKQLSGKTDGNFVSKVRIAKYSDGSIYFEEYYNETSSTGNNMLYNSFTCICGANKSNYVGTYTTDEPTDVLVETEIVDMD